MGDVKGVKFGLGSGSNVEPSPLNNSLNVKIIKHYDDNEGYTYVCSFDFLI